MKNRNIPFGYQYVNGVVAIDSAEQATVQRIIQAYQEGMSLLKIAEMLSREQVEYQPGITKWNKARIKHILDDERYIGKSDYPALLDMENFAAIQAQKSRKNNQKEVDRQSDIFRISVPVLCPKCGSEMGRRHDRRCQCSERWTCRNKECCAVIKTSADGFLGQITEYLNDLIQNPELIKSIPQEPVEPITELWKLEHEIERELDAVNFDHEVLRKKIMQCVSLKYQTVSDTEYVTQKLKADFERSSQLSAFSSDLFGRTVKAVYLKEDSTLDLILMNGQRFGKEQS